MTKPANNRYFGTKTGPPTDLKDFDDWLNCWAFLDQHADGLKGKAWRRGYERAVSDIRGEFVRLMLAQPPEPTPKEERA